MFHTKILCSLKKCSSTTYGWCSRRWRKLSRFPFFDPFFDAPISLRTRRWRASRITSRLLGSPSSKSSSTQRKPAPTQQPVRTRQRSLSGKRFPHPQRQGPRPKIRLRPETLRGRGKNQVSPRLDLPQKSSFQRPSTLFCSGCQQKNCLCHVVNVGPVLAPALQPSVSAEKNIKHRLCQKNCNLPLTMGIKPPPGSLPPQNIQPIAKWAEAWQAIPRVSDWVLGLIARGYTLQFTCRPPRMQGADTHVLRTEVININTWSYHSGCP